MMGVEVTGSSSSFDSVAFNFYWSSAVKFFKKLNCAEILLVFRRFRRSC